MKQADAILDPTLLRRLLRARDRMDAAAHESWPVARLARVSGVSESHFARCFKAAFGAPPHRYLLSRRVERAQALLRETELPVTDFAARSGWRSLGSFSRTFRDVVGISPTEFRARAAGEGSPIAAIPACVLRAALRPDLRMAVSEKRRQEADTMQQAQPKELP